MTIHADLYDTDFYAWCEEQAALLTRQDPWSLDRAEPGGGDSLDGPSDKRALGSHLQGLAMRHLKVAVSTPEAADWPFLALHDPQSSPGD